MRIVIFSTPQEKAQGLIGMLPIPRDTLFIFPNVRAGQVFHSQGVLEPFQIAFIASSGVVLDAKVVFPPRGLVRAPKRTTMAIEAKVGMFQPLGISPGRILGELSSSP